MHLQEGQEARVRVVHQGTQVGNLCNHSIWALAWAEHMRSDYLVGQQRNVLGSTRVSQCLSKQDQPLRCVCNKARQAPVGFHNGSALPLCKL